MISGTYGVVHVDYPELLTPGCACMCSRVMRLVALVCVYININNIYVLVKAPPQGMLLLPEGV